MTRPTVRKHVLDSVAWHVVTAHYPSAKMGVDAYQRLLRKTPTGELGIYRHGPPEEGGTNISIVSLDRAQVERAARHLAAGQDLELHPALVEAMIVRRARVVVEAAAAGQPAGRIKIRHAGAGARLDPDGTMHEPGGGVG